MATATKAKKARQDKGQLDRFVGLTREHIRALLEIELDALGVKPDDEHRGPLEHTVSTIARRMADIGINCNDAWRERFAMRALANKYYGSVSAYRWFKSMQNPKESKAFRELCVQQCDITTAKEYCGTLTDAEYRRIGRLILRQRRVDHDDLVKAHGVFVSASDHDGVGKVFQRALRDGDFRYIAKYAHQPLHRSEKVELAHVLIRDAQYAEDVQRVVAYIRRERIVVHVRNALCNHFVRRMQGVTFGQMKRWFAAVGRPLTHSYVQKYITSHWRIQPETDVLQAIDWLLTHGASKAWAEKRDALRRKMHREALRGVNPEWAERTAKLANRPLTTEQLLTFATRCREVSAASQLRRYALDRAAAQIAAVTGAPKTKLAKAAAS